MTEENTAENAPARHRADCWCNGTGWRADLGVRCNLPQLTNAEADYLTTVTSLGVQP